MVVLPGVTPPPLYVISQYSTTAVVMATPRTVDVVVVVAVEVDSDMASFVHVDMSVHTVMLVAMVRSVLVGALEIYLLLL